MNAQETATSIINTLAKASLSTNPADHTFFDYDCWPQIATELIREGYHWPALKQLAAMTGSYGEGGSNDEQAKRIERLTAELIEQTPSDNSWPFWDIMCAVVTHQWSLEKPEDGLAETWMYANSMDAMWSSGARRIPQDQMTPAVKLIWKGMSLSELVGFQNIDKEMTEVLEEASKLEPQVPFDAQTCAALIKATY